MPFGQSANLIEMLDERSAIERELGGVKGRLAQLNERITEATKPMVDNILAREGKSDGTVKFALDNHIFKAVIDKRVEWDTEKLRWLMLALSPEDANALFTVKYTVAEATFKKVMNPELRAALTAARTVKYGEPKISLAD